MVGKLKQYIREHHLLENEGAVILGFSGGVDSVVLCDLLLKLNIQVILAHCNYHLRGEESDEDEKFCIEYAAKHGFTIEIKQANLSQGDEVKNIQAAAREIRYKWFEELRIKHQAKYIITAHHADDNFETITMNFFRGTSVNGLTGIKPAENFLHRPFLFASKNEIISYAEENHLKFRNDSSNLTNKYRRNHYRNTVLPAVEALDKDYRKGLTTTMQNMIRYKSFIDEQLSIIARAVFIVNETGLIIDKYKLLQTSNKEIILYHILKDFLPEPLNTSEVFDLCGSQSGRKIIYGGYILYNDREKLVLQKKKQAVDKSILITDDINRIDDPIKLHFETIYIPHEGHKTNSTTETLIDKDLLKYPLELRLWKKGDKFIPTGMHRNKNISDLLTDMKVPVAEKKETWVLLSDGKVVWVVGKRLSEEFKVRNNTKSILKINFITE